VRLSLPFHRQHPDVEEHDAPGDGTRGDVLRPQFRWAPGWAMVLGLKGAGTMAEKKEEQALMDPFKIKHVDAWLLDYARPRGGVVTVRDGEYMVG